MGCTQSKPASPRPVSGSKPTTEIPTSSKNSVDRPLVTKYERSNSAKTATQLQSFSENNASVPAVASVSAGAAGIHESHELPRTSSEYELRQISGNALPPRSPAAKDTSSSTPQLFPTLASVTSFRTDTPESYILNSSSPRLTMSPFISSELAAEEKGFYLLHSICQQRSSFIQLLKACRLMYTTLDGIYGNQRIILISYRNNLDSIVWIMARCIEQSIKFNVLQLHCNTLRNLLVYYHLQLKKYTQERFFQYLYLSKELSNLLDSLLQEVFACVSQVLTEVEFTPDASIGLPSKEYLRFQLQSITSFSTSTSSTFSKVVDHLREKFPIRADCNRESISSYVHGVWEALGDYTCKDTLTNSINLYLSDCCHQSMAALDEVPFDIASILPNVALQDLWRRYLPKQASVNARELALHFDTELMKDESSLLLSLSSMGYPSSVNSIVDIFIDIFGSIGKSHREISVFELARYSSPCEVYWTLMEVVTFILSNHLVSQGMRYVPALSQLTPYFADQSQSILLRDDQYQLIHDAVLTAPFTLLFGASQTGKTFRLRHILDESDWKDSYHLIWIDCAQVVGTQDLQVAMLTAMNTQLYLGQSQTELILSEFSCLLHYWTKHMIQKTTKQARTTCLVFDHVSPVLLSSLQPFASLIGLNSCKLLMVLQNVDNMDALQYTLATEPSLATMITENTSIIEITALECGACKAILTSFQELALEARQQQVLSSPIYEQEVDDVQTADLVGIAQPRNDRRHRMSNNSFHLLGEMSMWSKPFVPLSNLIHALEDESIVVVFMNLPGAIAEFCYNHQPLTWLQAKYRLDTTTMLDLLSVEEKLLLQCIGIVIGALSADVTDESLMYRWRFSMNCLWRLWRSCEKCVALVHELDYLHWQTIWKGLVCKGLLKKLSVSVLTSYSYGEEYTLTKEALCLFSVLIGESDSGMSKQDTSNIVSAFLTYWLDNLYSVSHEIVLTLNEIAVGCCWLDYHQELFRRIVYFLVSDCRMAETDPNGAILTIDTQQEMVALLLQAWCVCLRPLHDRMDVIPNAAMFPSWLSHFHSIAELTANLRKVVYIVYFLWELLSCLMSSDKLSLPSSITSIETFLVHVVMLRIKATLPYWSLPHSTSNGAMRARRSSILWGAYALGKLFWELSPTLLPEDAVYDYLEELRIVTAEEITSISSSLTPMNFETNSSKPQRWKSRHSENGTPGVISKKDEDLRMSVKRTEAEICLLLSQVTASTIRRLFQGKLQHSPSPQFNCLELDAHSETSAAITRENRESTEKQTKSCETHVDYLADNDDVSSSARLGNSQRKKLKASLSQKLSRKLSSERTSFANKATAGLVRNNSARLLFLQKSNDLQEDEEVCPPEADAIEDKEEENLFCLSASMDSAVMTEYITSEVVDHHSGTSIHSDWDEDENISDSANLLMLLESYITCYLLFYQDLYKVKIPSAPPLLSNVFAMNTTENLQSTDHNISDYSNQSDSTRFLLPTLTLPTVQSLTSLSTASDIPILSPTTSSRSSFGFFGGSSLPTRASRLSRNSGGSLLNSSKTLSLRLMADPLSELSDIFLTYFVATDDIARTRCLFYCEQALQCKGKSRREGYDYDHLHYSQALSHYARKVLGRFLLAESARHSVSTDGTDSWTVLRDEIMRNYMDIQRILHQKTQFQVTDEVDNCYVHTSYYLGMFWYQQQRFEEATWCFAQVLSRAHGGQWLYESLRSLIADAALYHGNCLSQRKQFAAAIAAYALSLQVRPVVVPLSERSCRTIIRHYLHTLTSPHSEDGSTEGISRHNSNLSVLHGDNAGDINIHRTAIHLPKAEKSWIDELKRLADTCNNFALALMKEKKYEDASSYFEHALMYRRCLLTITYIIPMGIKSVPVVAPAVSLLDILEAIRTRFSIHDAGEFHFTSADSYLIEELSTLAILLTTWLPSDVLSAPPTSALVPPSAASCALYPSMTQILDNLAQCHMHLKHYDDSLATHRESLQIKQFILYPEWDNIYSYGNLARRTNVHSSSPIPVQLYAVFFASRQDLVQSFLSLAWIHRLRLEYLFAWQWIERAVSEAQKLVPFTSASTSSAFSEGAVSPRTPKSGKRSSKARRPSANGGSSTRGANTKPAVVGSNSGKSMTSGGDESGNESVTSASSASIGGTTSNTNRTNHGNHPTTSSLISKWEENAQQHKQQQLQGQQVIKLYVDTLEAKAALCELFVSPIFSSDQLPHVQWEGLPSTTTPPTGWNSNHLPTTRDGFHREAVRLLQLARTQYVTWFGSQDSHIQDLDRKLQSLWSKYG